MRISNQRGDLIFVSAFNFLIRYRFPGTACRARKQRPSHIRRRTRTGQFPCQLSANCPGIPSSYLTRISRRRLVAPPPTAPRRSRPPSALRPPSSDLDRETLKKRCFSRQTKTPSENEKNFTPLNSHVFHRRQVLKNPGSMSVGMITWRSSFQLDAIRNDWVSIVDKTKKKAFTKVSSPWEAWHKLPDRLPM